MKKNLLTAVMLIAIVMLSKAQQKGVGINTTTPAATLDVVANIRDRNMADAVLVPRMTAAQLAEKDEAYKSAQNGALVFITSGTGTPGSKTENINGTGFYYYDDPSSKWASIGGGTVAPTNFRLNLAQAASTSYDWSNSDFDFWEFTSGTQLTLPSPASYSGRTIYLRNNTGGTVQFNGANGVGMPKGLTSFTAQAAIRIYSDGTTWYLFAGRN